MLNDQLPNRAASGYRDELLNLWKDPAIWRFAQFRADETARRAGR